jgi:hypothetical protein
MAVSAVVAGDPGTGALSPQRAVAFVAMVLVATMGFQFEVAEAKAVTVDAWAHATCKAAAATLVAINKNIRRSNRALAKARDETEQTDAVSEFFTSVADAYDHLLDKMDATGKPVGKNAQKIATTVQEGFDRARDVYRRSSFNVNMMSPDLMLGVDELLPPGLVDVNSRELRKALRKYPAPSLEAAFMNEPGGCGDLYFTQILLEEAPTSESIVTQ